MSETPLITRSSSSTDRRMVRGAERSCPAPRRRSRRPARRGSSAPGASASISALSSPAGHFLAGVDRGDHLADPVDDREHRADQRAVGVAAAGADVGQRVLGGVAQRLQPREIEEAAIAFDGVDEAEDGIEPRAVVGLGFPGDDLAAQGFEHFPALGYEIGNQIVHRRLKPPAAVRARLMPARS